MLQYSCVIFRRYYLFIELQRCGITLNTAVHTKEETIMEMTMSNTNVDILYLVRTTVSEYPSSGTLKAKIF